MVCNSSIKQTILLRDPQLSYTRIYHVVVCKRNQVVKCTLKCKTSFFSLRLLYMSKNSGSYQDILCILRPSFLK